VSGVFKAGQLVAPVTWTEDGCDLFSVPGGARPIVGRELPRIIGRLEPHDIGLVIAIERADGGAVYVIGPHGGGWAFGAFLIIIKEAIP
jgi:hypothetical protein